jgi:hypothetical protein
LSTTNPTCSPDENPDRRGGKPATNRLSYGTALFFILTSSKFKTQYKTYASIWETNQKLERTESNRLPKLALYYKHNGRKEQMMPHPKKKMERPTLG